MNKETEAYIKGFIKSARDHGLSEYHIAEILKEAGFMDNMMDGAQNLGNRFGLDMNNGFLGRILSKLRTWFGSQQQVNQTFPYNEPTSTNTSPMRLANQTPQNMAAMGQKPAGPIPGLPPTPAPAPAPKPIQPFGAQAQKGIAASKPPTMRLDMPQPGGNSLMQAGVPKKPIQLPELP